MKNILILISSAFITSCASIGAVIDGGKDLRKESNLQKARGGQLNLKKYSDSVKR